MLERLVLGAGAVVTEWEGGGEDKLSIEHLGLIWAHVPRPRGDSWASSDDSIAGTKGSSHR